MRKRYIDRKIDRKVKWKIDRKVKWKIDSKMYRKVEDRQKVLKKKKDGRIAKGTIKKQCNKLITNKKVSKTIFRVIYFKNL